MQKKTQEILMALVLGMLYPAVLFSMIPIVKHGSAESTVPSSIATSTTESTAVAQFGILVQTDMGTVAEMELDDYITAVVLCEMPASFEMEALKAQAVVARTYALKRYESGTKHTTAAVCTDPACCQGFTASETYLSEGGDPALLKKVRSAVQETTGQILTYHDALIEATYFSCSGGMTEDAAAVWGSDIPYLQATKSPGEETASHYVDTVQFTVSEFKSKLGIADREGCRISNIRYTDGGGVDTMEICDASFTGTMLRSRLGLRSTAMSMVVVGDTVTITTKGFGHRVGMSQYGAEAMAVGGAGYEQILMHYYAGAELSTMGD